MTAIDLTKFIILADNAKNEDPSVGAQEKANKKLADQVLEQKLESKKNHENMRKEYAPKAYNLVVYWSIALFILIFLNALINLLFNTFITSKEVEFISEKIILALITGTTINVVAVFVIVMKNLFPKESDAKSR